MKRIPLFLMGLLALASCSAPNANSPKEASDYETIEKVIMERRSIRQYTDVRLDRDEIKEILQCGINAPNGMGRQAYEIRVIDQPELLSKITESVLKDNEGMSLRNGASNIFNDATCVVFIANDTSYDVSQVDCGLLGENIVLSAWAKGIGSCCMASPIRSMKDSPSCAPFLERLDFSEGYDLLYCIGLGYADESPEAKPRKDGMIRFVDDLKSPTAF